jgi:hypothetical protein
MVLKDFHGLMLSVAMKYSDCDLLTCWYFLPAITARVNVLKAVRRN